MEADATPMVYRRAPHVLAVLTACAVFPLIFVGAGVTSKDAGMVFPDGITSNGYFWNPPGWWQMDQTRWEHGHRLLGRAVGLLAIALAAVSWRCGGTMRLLGVLTLFAIVTQGVLGIFRVTQISTALAMGHGIFGQACFCLAAVTALVASRAWVEGRHRRTVRAGDFLQRLCLAGTLTLFLQLISGAAQRHFPSNPAVIVHVLLAVGVTLLVGWIVLWVLGQHPDASLLCLLACTLGLLMVAQLLAGGVTFLVVVMGGPWSSFMRWAAPTTHVAVGTLLLACSVLLTACSYHMFVSVPGKRRTRVASPTSLAGV